MGTHAGTVLCLVDRGLRVASGAFGERNAVSRRIGQIGGNVETRKADSAQAIGRERILVLLTFGTEARRIEERRRRPQCALIQELGKAVGGRLVFAFAQIIAHVDEIGLMKGRGVFADRRPIA